MSSNHIVATYVPIEQLKPFHNSVRTHSARTLKKLRSNVERLGLQQPLLVDERCVIIDGHARLEAARSLGFSELPVIVVQGLTPDEIRALRLAVNRLPQDARLDADKLRDEIEALIAIDFDIDLTGYDAVEIDNVLEIDSQSEAVVDGENMQPDREVPPASSPDDIWICDRHRVMCADCRDIDANRRLMSGQVAKMMFADPPYNVKIDGHVTSGGRHREFAVASGELSEAEFISFLTAYLTAATSVLEDGAVAFSCIDWRHICEHLIAARRAELSLLNVAVWVKTNLGLGSFYRSQHELVLVLKNGKAPHRNNIEHGKNGRTRSNVWNHRGMNSFSADRDELLAAHPTVKPVPLVADAIRDVSRRGDIVLDPFLGSGTTLIAAEETGRKCFGMEIDPAYVDLAVTRWQGLTGKDARCEATGQVFDERQEKSMSAPSAAPQSSAGYSRDVAASEVVCEEGRNE